MSKPLFHLDADTSIKALQAALLSRSHDVTRTPTEWMALGFRGASHFCECVKKELK
ncbi:hypothetical protein [Microcoleus asticus]|uniref:Uncharacterized protein n=1 Tax=Microcoleus asticus IPMA8 TaxID=2563858 RepID=A0ABX2D6I0_9CYAN|nr:hypothetical protein [Microcoleus asticus]NQE37547.1 hypothetical protein [Microcoleus asticus IPMA8]